MPTAPRPELTGLLLDGRYQIQRALGEGGFATVYLGLDRRLHDREVAIKVLHPEHLASADHVGRFAREIKVAARIGASCEHLVQISDHGRSADPPLLYFVMEYLAGPSLRQLLIDPAASAAAGRRVQRPLPWPRAVTLTLQLCAALSALHRHGVVHRDIKPENLLIDITGVGDLLKLLDYGIAGLEPGAAISGDGPRTAVQQRLGTPRYMAPEQLHEGECDHRVDIYAAGAVLAELLTGEPPNAPGGPPLAAPSQRRPDAGIPVALDELVLRATAWDPSARFASADELASALIRVLRDSAAAAAADDATTLAAVRGALTRADLASPSAARPREHAPPPAALPARPSATPGGHDRLLHRLGRLAAALSLTSSTLGALALVFALFSVVRHARSQASSPTDRLLREDRVQTGPDELAQPTLPSAAPLPRLAPPQPAEPPQPEPPQPAEPPHLEPAQPAEPPAPAPDLPTPLDDRPSPAPPAPASAPPGEPPRPEPAPPEARPAPALTIEQIVRAAERKIRARCGSRGGDRMVEYTLVFVPGTVRVKEVRVEGEHQGRELGDCVEITARAIDFTGARDRVNELPRALYRM